MGAKSLDAETQAFRSLAEQRAVRLADARAALTKEISILQKQIDDLDEELAHLSALIAPDPKKREEARPDPGEPIADLVVRLLEETGAPLHYQDIERELRERGLAHGTGENPANALLARYFNDPRLYRPRRGTYALRAWDRSAKSVGVKRAKVRRRRA